VEGRAIAERFRSDSAAPWWIPMDRDHRLSTTPLRCGGDRGQGLGIRVGRTLRVRRSIAARLESAPYRKHPLRTLRLSALAYARLGSL